MPQEYEDKPNSITFSEKMWNGIEKNARRHHTSPYYFAKMVAARFVSHREKVDMATLMSRENASEVASLDYLNSQNARTVMVTNGLTEAFWEYLESYANIYDMTKAGYFKYIILRYLDDEKYDELGNDLSDGFGIIKEDLPEDEEPIDFTKLF